MMRNCEALSHYTAIVVPCYNEAKNIKDCVNSLLNLEVPTEVRDIIVVNDASTDGTQEILSSFGNKIRVIEHSENKGRAAARNTGIRAIKPETTHVAFLDGDMWVRPNWLQQLHEKMSKHDAVGVVGNVTAPKSGCETLHVANFFNHDSFGPRRYSDDEPIHFKHFVFSTTLVRKDVLDESGLFDESFRVYGGEDTDLAIRIWESQQGRIFYSKEAIALHRHIRTIGEIERMLYGYGEINIPKLERKYPHLAQYFGVDLATGLRGALIFNDVVNLCVKRLLSFLPPRFTKNILKYLFWSSSIRGYRRYLHNNKNLRHT